MIVHAMPYPAGGGGIDPVAAGVVGDGAWTWFNEPNIITIANKPLIGAISSAGRLLAYHNGGSVDLRGSLFQVDDHNDPTFVRRASDGRIRAFASAHNGTGLYTYLSTNPDDPSAFGAETNLDSQLGGSSYAYTNSFQLTGLTNDPIYLFTRESQQYRYSVSTDGGTTWAALTQLLTNNGDGVWPPYVRMVQNGDSRIDFFCTDGHPSATATNSIYHFYFDGTFRKTDGTALTLPILPATDLTKVYDGTTTRAWIWDAAIDGSGNACCAYTTFPSTTDHRYNFARWNGTGWDTAEICAGGGYLYTGQPYYSGGISIDPDDVSRIACSREVNGTHQVWRYTTADYATWTGEQISKGERAFRPRFVRGATTEARLAYVRGNYHSYTQYDTDVYLEDSTRTAVTLSADASHASTVLIAPFDGPAGATTATDYSPLAATMTFQGSAAISALKTKWGVSAARINGSATTGTVNETITLPNSASYQLGSGDFTIEGWFSFDDLTPATADRYLVSMWRYDNGNRSWALGLTQAGVLQFIGSSIGTGGTTVLVSYNASALVVGQFYHIKVRRLSGTFYLEVDGVQVDSATTAFTFFNSNGTLNIGGLQAAASGWSNVMEGYVDGVRITTADRGSGAPTEQFPITA